MGTDKLAIVIFLLAFWLFLPVPLMVMNVGGFGELGKITILDIPLIYLKLLVLNIPDTNIYLLRFGNFLQMITLLSGFLLLRGD